MRRITPADHIRYQFDNLMSKGPIALIGWLFALSLLLIFAVSSVVLLLGVAPAGETGRPLHFLEIAWMSLMRTLDPGTMGGDSGSWLFLLLMLTVTLGGIFVVSLLIGILSSGLEEKMIELRKGRSLVVETGHTVILGWSPQVFSLISELAIANENKGGGCIAILAEKDKVAMEDEIRDKAGSLRRTRVVCRSGNPIDLTDLEIINPHAAKSIILLSPEKPDPDSHVIKTILAITNNPHRRPNPYHIVAEIREPANMQAGALVGKNEAALVLASETVSRIMVQTCRQSGLSVAFTELLDFGGDEIYFQEEPALFGKTYADAVIAYEDSAVIGLAGEQGVRLNPPGTTSIEPGDRIIAISEDDDTVKISGNLQPPADEACIRHPRRRRAAPERTLILGWNHTATVIINDLAAYVAPGSLVTIVADDPEIRREIRNRCPRLNKLKVVFRLGDTTDRAVLESLHVEKYHHVITLAYSDRLDPQTADAKTLITLLHLRELANKSGHSFSIVSEMQDLRNRDLAEVTRADDFIVSDTLISLLLSQISENKSLLPVFQDLFDPEGPELYLKDAGDYIVPGRPVSYYTVVQSAIRCGETAIGYRLRAESDHPQKAHGVHLNPNKSELVVFQSGDKIIVLAES